MGVKRQQGGADQGDLFDEALRRRCATAHRGRRNRTWSARGAASAHGMGPGTSLDAAPDGSGERLREPEPGLQAGQSERRRAGGGRDDRRDPARLDRREPRTTDREPAGRQLPTTAGAGCAIPKPGGGSANSAFPPSWTVWCSKRSRKSWNRSSTRRSRHRASASGLDAAPTTRCARPRSTWRTGMRLSWTSTLEKFFDRVNHDILMARLARRIGDKRLLHIVRRFLQAGMMVNGVCDERHGGNPARGTAVAAAGQSAAGRSGQGVGKPGTPVLPLCR